MIYVITGAPCSGKTTYVSEKAKENELIIDYDSIAEALGAKRYEATGRIQAVALEVREKAIDMALTKPDENSWIIHSNPNEEKLKRYEDAGAEIITLDPGKDVCLERAKADGRPESTFIGIHKWYAEEKGKEKDHMKYKTVELKADDTGTIKGYFSTYDEEPDSYGDIIKAGAFTETFAKRKESGHPFPLCWNHNFDNVIGVVDSIEDTDKGPFIEAHFLDTPKAQEVREFVKSGAVYQFSFAYDVLECERPTKEQAVKGIENVLTKLEVFEISVVTVPANQNAVVTEVKSGRRNSAKDLNTLDEVENLINQALDKLKTLKEEVEEPTEDTSDEAEEAEEVATEVNGAPEEQKSVDNSRKEALLAFIKTMKEGSLYES